MYCSGCSCNSCKLKREADQGRALHLKLQQHFAAMNVLLMNNEQDVIDTDWATALKTSLLQFIDQATILHNKVRDRM